ncbi:MAG TPA: hypothetical protein VKU60_04425 [Chloroflexota bacterium]|nr:hypothetical protein [Chloroflexota bacterium]
MLAVVALLAIIVYTPANITVVHFQRFVTAAARKASAELGGDGARQLRALQSVMTPMLSVSLGWLCYVVLALSFVFAYRAWGWFGAGPILAWAVIGTNLLDRSWPWPSRQTCADIAAVELQREGKMRQLEPDERAMVTELLLQTLKEAATEAG